MSRADDEFMRAELRNAVDLTRADMDAICAAYAERFGPLPHEMLRSDIVHDVCELIKAAP